MEDKQTASDRIQNRNIIDMLRDDQSSAAGSKKNWKTFRDRLRLKRAGKAWTSSVPIPTSDPPMNTNRMMIRRGSSRYPTDPNADELDGEATRQLGYMPDRQRSGRLLPVETDPEEEDGGGNPPDDDGESKSDQQMSLMSLLSDHGSHYNAGPDEHVEEHHEEVEEEEEEEEEEKKEEKEEEIGDYNICGGCRGKHKNAAFGPCGHTFCRNCTKELHISIGNCPTCSNYMLEILDIY